MALHAMWVPGYVAAAENVGGGGPSTSDGPLKNFDGGSLGNVPMHDYQDVVGYRQGSGVRFRGKRDQRVWFHFAIPTPVVMSDRRTTIVKVFVMWKTLGGAQLEAVHVWDGFRGRMDQWNDINLSGDFSGGPAQPGAEPKLHERQNMFTLNRPQPVFYGVGVSALIHFDINGDDSEVSFHSAGADFVT